MENIISFQMSAADDAIFQHICRFAAAEYQSRYGISLDTFPDMFVYGTTPSDEIVACFGASWGSNHRRLTTEWYVPEEALATYIGSPLSTFPRAKLCEIGTRVVNLPAGCGTNSVRTSVAMSAALLLHLHKEGGQFSLFTADRSVQVIAKQLRVNLMQFGAPDLSRRDAAYIKRWQPYFDIPRGCYGFDLAQAAAGCSEVCEQLSQSGFGFDSSLFDSTTNTLAVSA